MPRTDNTAHKVNEQKDVAEGKSDSTANEKKKKKLCFSGKEEDVTQKF